MGNVYRTQRNTSCREDSS